MGYLLPYRLRRTCKQNTQIDIDRYDDASLLVMEPLQKVLKYKFLWCDFSVYIR